MAAARKHAIRMSLDRHRDTIRGLLPTFIFLATAFAISLKYDYLRTSIDKTVTGLLPATIYLLQHDSKACADDVVEYSSKRPGARSYIRRIAATSGALFSFTEAGYALDGKPFAMQQGWREKALGESKDQGTLDIPLGSVLIVNTEFDPQRPYTNWAFEILPRTQIKSVVTHILVSRDVSKLGERIAAAPGSCPMDLSP